MIRWDVVLAGVPPDSNLSYCDPVVPLPLNACILTDKDMDVFLFRKRKLFMSGEDNSGQITSEEYYKLTLDIEDLSNLEGFGMYLTQLHHWKCKIDTQTEERDDGGCYIPDGLPHAYDKEYVFLKNISLCWSIIHTAKCF